MPASPDSQTVNTFGDQQPSPTTPLGVFGEQTLGNASSDSINTTTPPKSSKISRKKAFLAILGVILVIAAVVAGVFLVQRQQDLREQASSASACDQDPNCVVFDNPGNEGVREVNRQIVRAVITNKPGNEAEFGQGNYDEGCYRVNIDSNTINWQKYGPGPDCKDVSNIQIWVGDTPPTATPTDTPPTSTPATPPGTTATPTEVITGTPTSTTPTTPPGITAQCLSPKAYDTEWNLLSQSDLSSLSPGDTVRFAVSGTTTSGFFDKARFTINGIQRPDVTSKKPGTQEFFDEYVIPEDTTSFKINAQVYHSNLGWF